MLHIADMLNYIEIADYLLSNLDAQGDLSSPELEYMEAGYMDVLMDQVTTFPYWVPALAVNTIKIIL